MVKSLFVLILSFALSLLVFKVLKKQVDWALAGRISMSIMLAFTAISHFVFTQGMAMMVPQPIPYKTTLVYITGGIEIALAIALLLSQYTTTVGWLAILFLILILPANIYASVHNINLQTADFTGKGLTYLWFRVPLQLFFIVWIYASSIRQ